jgi:hypothetical protein
MLCCRSRSDEVGFASVIAWLHRIGVAGNRRKKMREIRVERPEITTIDRRGFWLRWRDEELYVPFALFPWFEHATVAQLCHIEHLGRECLYWPGLDLELALDRIRHPMAAAQSAIDC